MASSKSKISIRDLIRALRLPFITASVFPFLFGSLIERTNFSFTSFVLGLLSVIFTHLGANLINDYADSKSGVDWHDRKFYRFFGGSKLIQQGILPERFYLGASFVCFSLASFSIIALTLILKNVATIVYFMVIVGLGVCYSHRPFRFSYHRLGEFIIFLLFGPAPVMGAYFIQTQAFPTLKSFLVSLPFGFFTTAILFSNEVPDYIEDSKGKKYTWVHIVGQERAFLVYYLLVFLGFLSIALNIAFRYLGFIAIISFIFILPALRAGAILKTYPHDKIRLIESSQITIALQALVSIVLLIDILL